MTANGGSLPVTGRLLSMQSILATQLVMTLAVSSPADIRQVHLEGGLISEIRTSTFVYIWPVR